MKISILVLFLLAASPAPAQETPRPPDASYNAASGGLSLLYYFYHYLISSQDGPSCRYTPTCSAYARQAVAKHGIIAGSFLAADRLTRCNPSHPSGPDPVPETVIAK